MADLTLSAELTLDSKSFTDGLNGAAEEAKAFAQETEAAASTAKKNAASYRSDVMKQASENRKAGMSQSEALKAAYASVDKSLYDLKGTMKGTFSEGESAAKSSFSGMQEAAKSSFDGMKTDAEGAGKSISASLSSFGSEVKKGFQMGFGFSIANSVAGAISSAKQAVAEFVKESISAASDLQEVQNVVDVTFGEASGSIQAWAENARQQFGLTELQAKQYSSTLGAMLKSMGIAGKDVYTMSTQLSGLAADMASFYNLDFDTAFQKIRSGISGETEPLKQLGINLSVANLEAYALSQGITQSYEAMSAADQAILRYQYLMKATADAQGDFARTSDSYANSLRLLETNWDTLKTRVGEAIVPVLASAVSAVNDLFDAMNPPKTLEETLGGIEQGYAANAIEIRRAQSNAEALVGTIKELESKESLTADETLRLQGATEALVEIYPDLKTYVDETTGKFNTSATAIEEETKKLAENALAKARLAANEEKLATAARAVVEAEDDERTKSAKATTDRDSRDFYQNVFSGKHKEAEDKFNQIVREMGIQEGLAIPDASEAIDSIARTMAEGGEFFKAIDNITYAGNLERVWAAFQNSGIDELIPEIQSASASYLEFESAAEASAAAEEESIAAREAAKATYDELAASITGAGEAAETTAGSMAKSGSNLTPLTTQVEGMTDVTEQFTKSLEDLKKQGETVQDLLKDIEQYKLNNVSQMRKQVEGLYDTFEKASRVRPANAKKMLAGLDSQLEQAQRWKDAFAKIKEMGASDELLAQFDYSPESIAQMEALIKGGDDKITAANEKLAALQTEQQSIAETMSETALSVDEQFAQMTETAKTEQEKLTAMTEDIVAKAQEMSLSVKSDTDAAGEDVKTLTGLFEALCMEDWVATAKADDQASSIIQSVDEALNSLNGKTATVYISAVQQEGEGTPHATGLDYVPYDNYAARLHTGEAVLTKLEAQRWRSGQNQKADAKPITVNLTVNGGGNAREIADEVRNALELMRWRS